MLKISLELDGCQTTVELEEADVQFLACLSPLLGKAFSPKKTYSITAKDISNFHGADISSTYEIAQDAIQNLVYLPIIFNTGGRERLYRLMLMARLEPPKNENDVIAEFTCSEQGCGFLPVMIKSALNMLKSKQS